MRVVPCYKCHQRIWFGETERGKLIPINTWTTAKGNVVAIDPDADRPMVRWLKKGEEPEQGVKRYISHINTCRVKKQK